MKSNTPNLCFMSSSWHLNIPLKIYGAFTSTRGCSKLGCTTGIPTYQKETIAYVIIECNTILMWLVFYKILTCFLRTYYGDTGYQPGDNYPCLNSDVGTLHRKSLVNCLLIKKAWWWKSAYSLMQLNYNNVITIKIIIIVTLKSMHANRV